MARTDAAKVLQTPPPLKAEATCVPSPLPVWKFNTPQPAALPKQAASCSGATYIFLTNECKMPGLSAWSPQTALGNGSCRASSHRAAPGKQHQALLL